MAMESRKRQDKVKRRNAKERTKRKKAFGRDPRDIPARIERSAAAPILHSCTTSILWKQGMSNVLISRELTGGNVAFAVFLVDVYCLGVKDVTFNIGTRRRYQTQVYGKLFRDYEIVELEPAAARKLLEGAVEYARQFGITPHRDYPKAARICGDIDAKKCASEFTFGKDGQPFFVAGPHDSRSYCRQIVHRLTERCGPDGFHFFCPLFES